MNPISFLSLASKTAKAYESFCRPVCKKHRINQTCLDVILFQSSMHPDTPAMQKS